MIVAVGSRNPVKVEAAELAFKRFFKEVHVVSADVRPSIPAQPIGLAQVVGGAVERAYKALEVVDEAVYGVGLEAGWIEYPSSITGYMNHQVCALIDRDHGVSLGVSMGFEFPAMAVEKILGGEAEEVEEAMESLTGIERIGEKMGAIGYLTRGSIRRVDLGIQAVVSALIPRLNPDLYPSKLPRAEEILGRL